MTHHKNFFFFLLFVAMIGWGGSWVNAKVLGAYASPFELVFVRYLITSVSMIPVLLYFKKSFKIDLRTFGIVIIAAILMISYSKFFFLGTTLGTASLGGAFVTTLIPINTFIIFVLFFNRPMSKKDGFALGLGALGVMTILGVWHLSREQIMTVYNLYFILASLIWPLLTIVSSKSTKVSPMVFSFYMYVATMFLDLLLIDVRTLQTAHWDSTFWAHMIFLSLGATTFSTSVYFIGVEKLGSKEVSSFVFLVPFAAIGLSALFLGERISGWMIIGTIMTIIAVALLNNIIKIKRKKIETSQY